MVLPIFRQVLILDQSLFSSPRSWGTPTPWGTNFSQSYKKNHAALSLMRYILDGGVAFPRL